MLSNYGIGYIQEKGDRLKISYKKLRHLRIDHDMTPVEFQRFVGKSTNAAAKTNKDEPLALTVLLRICEKTNCDFSDIIEAIPNRAQET